MNNLTFWKSKNLNYLVKYNQRETCYFSNKSNYKYNGSDNMGIEVDISSPLFKIKKIENKKDKNLIIFYVAFKWK